MKFSIIIPTYNRAVLLDRCLQSLVNQTYKDFEVIVCDDGSTDNTREITEKYADNLHIQYIWAENWGGPARPRNKGIAKAQGDWICFLDSDDWWKPNKLEACLPHLEDFDFIYHDLKVVNTSSLRMKKRLNARKLYSDIAKDLIVNGNTICNSTVVVRKKIIDNVGLISEDKDLIAVEDYDYWIRIAQYTNKFLYIPLILGFYWVGSNNISINNKKHIERLHAIYKKYEFILVSEKEKEAAENTLYYNFARIYHQCGDYKSAICNYKKSINKRSSANTLIKSFVGTGLCMLHCKR